ncbi:transcription initiation factor TFIIH subunit 3 [Nematocida sp. AWRm80]|nr:transcription initiation factor TFIIH subunit 3 [Nematocida sp. AWRm80]
MLLTLIFGSRIEKVPDRIINDLLVFLRVFIRSSLSNRLIIIHDTKKKYFSEEDLEENIPVVLSKILSSPVDTDYTSDLGYALLLMHKEKDSSRILLFCSDESPFNFIKCAFTSKKYSIPISCVVLKDSFVISLPEMLKEPIYTLSSKEPLFNYLMNMISLNLNRPLTDSTRKVCICHQKEVTIGYLCPVCLGLYCKFVPLCKHCKIRFVF